MFRHGRNGHSASGPLGEGGKVIQRKKGLWRGEGGVNEEIETEKATGLQICRKGKGHIFGAGGALIQKTNKDKEKAKGKEERREKRKRERGEFNLEDPMFPINFHSFFQKIIK